MSRRALWELSILLGGIAAIRSSTCHTHRYCFGNYYRKGPYHYRYDLSLRTALLFVWGFPRLGLVRLVVWMLGFLPSIFIHVPSISCMCIIVGIFRLFPQTNRNMDSVQSNMDEHQ